MTVMTNREFAANTLPPCDEVLWRTDWLGTNPAFYNPGTGCWSRRISDLIDGKEPLRFDPDGLRIFLTYGFCAHGVTPVRDVRVLPPCTELCRVNGLLVERSLPDPAQALLEDAPPAREEDVIDDIRSSVRNWEESTDGPIVLPLSGGFDSRLLALCVRDRSRLRAFTYGTSACQSESREVVVAGKVAELLGIEWRHVQLHGFHRHLDKWYGLFGCSTHAHGMYQIEFFERLRGLVPEGEHPLLSGIIGDAWAGAVKCPPVSSPAEVHGLGYTHGMNADACASRLKGNETEIYERFFESQRGLLSISEGRVVLAMRFKMLLLRYLFDVPAAFGFHAWSPFLCPEIALAMLRLPPERRKNRVWQRDFFRREGVDIEAMCPGGNVQIALNRMAVDEWPLVPLDVERLAGIVRPDYVKRINRLVCGTARGRRWRDGWYERRNGLLDVPKVNGVLHRCGFREKTNPFAAAYAGYLTLWPLQRLVERG